MTHEDKEAALKGLGLLIPEDLQDLLIEQLWKLKEWVDQELERRKTEIIEPEKP